MPLRLDQRPPCQILSKALDKLRKPSLILARDLYEMLRKCHELLKITRFKFRLVNFEKTFITQTKSELK